MSLMSALFLKIVTVGGGTFAGFAAFLTQKTWLAVLLAKPIQGVLYVFGQVKYKSFMRKKKQLEQEIHDAELDTEDLSLPQTLEVYNTKKGMITQRMKKIRKLNQDILVLWRYCKRYDVTFGGEQGSQLMLEVEKARRAMDEAMSRFPELQKEMRQLDVYYDKEKLDIEDRLEEALMLRVNKWASVGKWVRVGLYVGCWFFAIFWSFDWLYSCFEPGSNLHEYMVTYANDLYPGYAEHVAFYYTTIHQPLRWVLFIVGGGLLFWKRLFMGRAVYVEFTRKMFVVLRGLAILALGVAFVTLSMHYILPLIQTGGFVYEVFLKDYPDFASLLSNIVFGLAVFIGWGLLTYKSSKKLFYDPRKIVVPQEHTDKAIAFYENQKEICKLYNICALSYLMLIIKIEHIRDEKEAVFEDFQDIEVLRARSLKENEFFENIATEEVLEELNDILPSRYAYRQKKLAAQQDV